MGVWSWVMFGHREGYPSTLPFLSVSSWHKKTAVPQVPTWSADELLGLHRLQDLTI